MSFEKQLEEFIQFLQTKHIVQEYVDGFQHLSNQYIEEFKAQRPKPPKRRPNPVKQLKNIVKKCNSIMDEEFRLNKIDIKKTIEPLWVRCEQD